MLHLDTVLALFNQEHRLCYIFFDGDISCAMLLENYRNGDYVRPGFWQIVLILIIACGVLLVARSSKRGTVKSTSQKVRIRRIGTANTDNMDEVIVKPIRQKRLRWLGIALIIIGMTALGILLSTIINYIFILSAVAGIIVFAGIIVIIISARR